MIRNQTTIEPEQQSFKIGGKQFFLPGKLKEIADQINDAKEILNYDADWDDENGSPTDEATFLNAIYFLTDYSEYIYKKDQLILATPYIDLLKDGSISIHWETNCGKLLIIFKRNAPALSFYYGERKENKIPFKSAIETGKPVDEFLALWMKKYLTR